MKIIKSSKKLNKLFDKLISLGDDEIVFGNLANDAYKTCLESDSNYRAIDYAEYVDAGIEMLNLAKKSNKDIYCVCANLGTSDLIFYFVNDIVTLTSLFKKYINQAEDRKIKSTDDEMANLENKLAKLKKKNNGK